MKETNGFLLVQRYGRWIWWRNFEIYFKSLPPRVFSMRVKWAVLFHKYQMSTPEGVLEVYLPALADFKKRSAIAMSRLKETENRKFKRSMALLKARISKKARKMEGF
jgi:hypothetical protein